MIAFVLAVPLNWILKMELAKHHVHFLSYHLTVLAGGVLVTNISIFSKDGFFGKLCPCIDSWKCSQQKKKTHMKLHTLSLGKGTLFFILFYFFNYTRFDEVIDPCSEVFEESSEISLDGTVFLFAPTEATGHVLCMPGTMLKKKTWLCHRSACRLFSSCPWALSETGGNTDKQ